MGDILKNFDRDEFECKCGCGLWNMRYVALVNSQRIRDDVGHSIGVSSGSRCPAHNKKEGGRGTSAHLYGLAVDYETPTSRTRFVVIESALRHGAKRIGIGRTFVHVDWDKNLPEEVAWLY